jgi:hypothetical protein
MGFRTGMHERKMRNLAPMIAIISELFRIPLCRSQKKKSPANPSARLFQP